MPRPIDAAYLAAAILASPVWLPRMMSTGKIRTDWPARFGRGEVLPKASRRRVLLHAVSVGEVNATDLLVDQLQDHETEIEPVVATTTDTGFARAKALFDGRCEVVRYPFDTSGAVRRLFDRVRPDAIGLVELEVWPNFLREAAKRHIPVAVVNGRLSERSHRRYARIAPIARRLFDRLAIAAVQDETYAARFRSMGVGPNRLEITGNMKWDTARISDEVPGAAEFAASMGIDRNRPLVVAGSTAPIEHAMLHQAVGDGVQLLCAPRKPEWFDDAAGALPGCARLAYALADVVVIGRTFGDLGGSDMIEPIALGKPTIIGPDVTNFAAIATDLLEAGGLIQTTPEQLPHEIKALLTDTSRAQRLVRDGRSFIRTRQGATTRHAEILRELATRKADS